MTIGGILNTGLRGMMTSQAALGVAGNNISNSATVGYTRRSTAVMPEDAATGAFHSTRIVDPYVQKRLLSAQSGSSEADATRSAVDVLDQVYAEGNGSLGDSLDQFQVAIQNLAANPNDTPTRQAVLDKAGSLATAFQQASQQLTNARTTADNQISTGIDSVNKNLVQIGQLGVQIQKAELNGDQASDLRDQRDQLLKSVATQIPISTIDQGNGQLTVLLGGSQQLVGADGTVSPLSVANDGNGGIKVTKIVAGQTTDVSSLVNTGAVGGLLKASTGALASAQNQLDTLAANVANQYNAAHSQGYAQDGSTGLNLFTPPTATAGAAANFQVSADVAGKPENIATAASSSALPSDNGNALALAAVASTPISIGGQTVSEALASMVGSAGQTVADATQSQTFNSGVLQQVQSINDSISGVSSDNEMVSVMQYQRSYQASLKVIQTADQMLSDLINIVGT